MNFLIMVFLLILFDYEQINCLEKVGEYRINKEKSVDDNSEKTKKKLPFYQSDPESEYAHF